MAVRVLVLIAALASASLLHAAPVQVRFTGPTMANNTLTVDTLKHVMLLGSGQFNCPTLEAVQVEQLPGSFVPPAKYIPAGAASVKYEKWNATFCGKVIPLLVGFWPHPAGGMMFQVSHPFPGAGDAPNNSSKPTPLRGAA